MLLTILGPEHDVIVGRAQLKLNPDTQKLEVFLLSSLSFLVLAVLPASLPPCPAQCRQLLPAQDATFSAADSGTQE